MGYDKSRKIRVIQWATGNTGQRALREVMRDPRYEVVGVLVYNPAKEGLDAGDLCGEAPIGVKATTDRDAILKLDADCVIYMPQTAGRDAKRTGRSFDELIDDIVNLTSAGKNVVTTCPELFVRGRRLNEDERDRVLAACERGGASIFGSGSSPGLLTETIPLPFLAFQRRVDRIEIEEFGDLSRRPSPMMVLEQMRFGKPLDDFDPDRRKDHLYREYQPPLEILAEAARMKIDRWTCEGGVAAARDEVATVSGPIKAGTAGAQRIIISGWKGDVECVHFAQYMYVTRDVEPQWDLRPTGWRIQIKSDAPVYLEYPFPIPLDELASYVPAFNANILINAIPYLMSAPPGFVTHEELPPILARGPL
jgi:4-hydroxy-tetrahydrodipicolinate reductase